jgi:hypothetical protein
MKTKTRALNSFSRFVKFCVAVICALFVANVCNAAGATNSASVVNGKGAETPEKLISRIAECCLAGDSTNLLKCFDTSTKVKEIGAKSFAISIEIVKAKMELRDALVKKFGAEKVAISNATYLVPAGENPLKKLSDSFQNPQIKVEGETAAVTFGSSSEIPLKLERKAQHWFLVRELEGMAVADEAEAFDRMEANRYYVLGLRDGLKAVPKTKTMEEADKKITAAVNEQMGNFLTQPVAEPKK